MESGFFLVQAIAFQYPKNFRCPSVLFLDFVFTDVMCFAEHKTFFPEVLASCYSQKYEKKVAFQNLGLQYIWI